ncbi:unnamed protein product [Rangifer tarandus platyrhynchus]|uniref:Uncharacterized protein n=2 Tax=Rangifer tarandus platyrhynchus TaxID=3082113 RepID=A0ABN8Y9G6_RANTA|nr:unnamed protein product [Rangifer tarandus platyrhynchus]
MLTMSGHRTTKMQSGLPLLPLRKVFRPKIALFELKCPSLSLFGQAEMVGFLLVKCIFHTVQLRNVGEHKTVGVPGGTCGPQPGKLVKKASWKSGGYAASKCMSRVSQVRVAERGCQAR